MTIVPSLRASARLLPLALLAACAASEVRVPPPPPEAAPRLRTALSADPANPDLAWRLASALRSGGRLTEAQQVVDSSLARAPEHVPNLHLRGVILEARGDVPGAIAAYERVLATDGSQEIAGQVEGHIGVLRRRFLEEQVRNALDDETSLTSTAPVPQTLAIFPFAYSGGEARLQPLGRALTHMLVTDMAATGRLAVLERLQVQLLADEFALSSQGLTDPATGVRGGRLLRAERVVQGQVGGTGERIELIAGVLESASGSDPDRVESEDALDRFFEAEGRLAVGIFEAIGIELTAAERERVGRQRTASLQALLEFGLGLEAQDAGRYTEAREAFERAVSLDPSFDDARRSLEEATALEEEEEDGDEFAWLGSDLLRPSPWEIWLDRNGTYLPIEGIIPDVGGRDPYKEVTDDEGIGPRSGTVIIVIPRPGGGDR